jgi:hypothetical protein
MPTLKDGKLVEEDVALRNAMNEVLRDGYVADCQRAVDKWNRTIERSEATEMRLRLPHRRFHRAIGLYAGQPFDVDGNLLERSEYERRNGEWLPDEADRAFVDSLMHPVYERGKIASWIWPAGARHQRPALRLRLRQEAVLVTSAASPRSAWPARRRRGAPRPPATPGDAWRPGRG